MFLHNPELLELAATIAEDQRVGEGPKAPPVTARPGHEDARWNAITRQLDRLHHDHRHAVRMVDLDCGCGALLIAAAEYARSVGFLAIEAKGVGQSAAAIAQARAAASHCRDCAIGLEFVVGSHEEALQDEADFPADILLWHGQRENGPASDLAMALRAAGDCLITDAPGADAR